MSALGFGPRPLDIWIKNQNAWHSGAFQSLGGRGKRISDLH